MTNADHMILSHRLDELETVMAAAMKRLEERVVALEERVDRIEQIGPSRSIIKELAALRIGPTERVILRVDPKLEDVSPGFHMGMISALREAGLAERTFVIALEPHHFNVSVVETETEGGDDA